MTTPQWREFGRPRKVAGGIKARSARGSIGDTWWSKAFIGALESFADKGRLTRGRSYARAGQVLSLDVQPGLVSAAVQGSRATPYKVRLGFPPLGEATWAGLERQLAAQALFAAHLLAGQVPHELVDLFAAEGVPLFPTRATDVSLDCSCPDWGWPCKHIAAACYLLAERFDEDPFTLLLWRGRTRSDLLDALQVQRGSGVVTPVVGTAAALGEPGEEPPVSRWWSSPTPLPPAPPVGLPDVPLSRQLGTPPSSVGGAEVGLLITGVSAGSGSAAQESAPSSQDS
ncbi:SWIM zinc finger family protein [Hamadaea sp. NPDC051192]|uniref:SWIM zinc finger family protein n=1 Tax=Hamadaea sp. NPDC051192 TaxID=3154940 RepID=UPI0034223E33